MLALTQDLGAHRARYRTALSYALRRRSKSPQPPLLYSALILSWLDYYAELKYFGERVLPLMKQAGLRV